MCQIMPRSRGFSLIESVMTMAVLGILGGLAAPAFNGMLLDSQRATAVNGFVHSVYLARSTAIHSGRTVSICRSPDGQTCSNRASNWEDGWIVFANPDRDEPPVRDENETVLAAFAAWNAGSITSNRVSYSFRPHIHGVINGTVVFCDRRGPSHARAIIINHAGRPRIATRDSDNRPLRCPTR